MKNYHGLLLFLLLFSAPFLLGMGEAPPDKKPAYDLTLPDLSGKPVHLAAQKGKVIFLNFWASWCPPCREEMPDIERLYKRMKGKDFLILAVSIDQASATEIKEFVRKGGYTFKVLLDAKGEAADRFGIYSIPTTFIIDKKGKIVSRIIGPRDWGSDEVVKEFKKLL